MGIYDWRKEWQERFPVENRNIQFDENHIADIVIDTDKSKTVIEFKNSLVTEENFYIETKFYLDKGYHVVWLVNVDRSNSRVCAQSEHNVWDWDYTTMLKLESHLFFDSGEFGVYEVLINRKCFNSLLATKTMTIMNFLNACYDINTFEREQTATLETSIMFATQSIYKPNRIGNMVRV